MTNLTDTPRTDSYYAGKGCECSAHNRSECGCDVDWTDPRIYELQAEVERLKANLRRAVKIAVNLSYDYIDTEYDDELDQLKANLLTIQK